MKRAFRAIFASVALVASGQTPVPVAKEPFHHLELENAWVRAYEVVVPSGKATLMHVHGKEYFFVDFGGATLRSRAAGQPEQDLILKDAEIRYSPAITHTVSNVGSNPFHNLTVELLQAAGGNPKSLPPPVTGGRIVFENDRIRATMARVDAGQSIGAGSRVFNTMTIVIDGGSLERRTVKPGDFEWHAAGSEGRITNSGKSAVRILEVELK